MWENLGKWLMKRFSSPLPVLFFLLGAALIIVEAVEIRLPDGTHMLRVNEFSVFVLALGIVLILAAALLQFFDRRTPQDKKSWQTDMLETRSYASLGEILQAYVDLPGGLDFAFCAYNSETYHVVGNEQLSRRLIHSRVHRNIEEQTKYYLDLAREVHSLAQSTYAAMKTLDQGNLFRLVYDMEKGGLFYTQVSDHCYVAGATVDQASMGDNTADLEMRSLVKTVEQHIAHLESQ